MEIVPITFKQASEFVNKYHRHHSASQGCKFCVGLKENDDLIGVAICGRPVSRFLDDGYTLEITRLCTIGVFNSCSKLYSTCVKIARDMGYKKIITYILKSELGTSLRASGFVFDCEAGGTHWTGSRNRGQNIPFELKLRFSKIL